MQNTIGLSLMAFSVLISVCQRNVLDVFQLTRLRIIGSQRAIAKWKKLTTSWWPVSGLTTTFEGWRRMDTWQHLKNFESTDCAKVKMSGLAGGKVMLAWLGKEALHISSFSSLLGQLSSYVI